MNEILTRSIEENDIHFLAQFPVELMNDEEAEMVNFILEYNRRHGEVPSVKRVSDSFEFFIPYTFFATAWEDKPAPLSDVYEQTIKRKLLDITDRMMREADIRMRADGEVPLEIFAEIEKIHTMSLGVNRYSTFDRESYFRRTALVVPFRLINSHIGGLADGDFMLIVGRLGTGKSTIAQYIAKFVWERGKKILFVSAEMLGADVFSRIDAMVGRFNPLALRAGKTREIVETLDGVVERIKMRKGEIIVPKSRLLTPSQISAFAKNLGVDLIMVDGAYLLQPSTKGFTSKWEKVATVSNELKQTALDLGLPLIATAQIKRGASGEDGYDPEDIALSDALGQDADFVIAIWPNKVMKERAELQLIKNRYGSTCATQIYIEFETMTITDETLEGEVEGAKPTRESVSMDAFSEM